MPGEIITLQAGQCGNQVGQQFWSQLCGEHGIEKDGMPVKVEGIERNDQPGVFFRTNSSGRYTPRAILIDLEPRVINSIKAETNDGLFDPKDIYVSSEGGGAANRWAEGYVNAMRNKEEILDMINREIDSCDNFEGFQLLHSVAGGTGSGFGSFLLEELSDNYSKKLVQTYSVFGASEVVVQPYNTVLTLKRLVEHSDANIIVDNNSLTTIASKNLQVLSPSYNDTNKLISTVMSACTNTLRFPSYSYNSLTSILSTLIPTPDLHFLIPSYTPFTSDFVNAAAKEIRGSTAYDVILEVLDKKLRMCSYNEPNGVNISVFDILMGTEKSMASQSESIQKALIKARERIQFAPWSSSAIHVAVGSKSPFIAKGDTRETNDIVSGLMLANSTSILPILRQVANQYDQLMHRNAFLNNYLNSDYDTEVGDIMDEFNDSREVLENQIAEYQLSESINYLNEVDEEDEEGGKVEGADQQEADVEMNL
ncbi:DEKNAAC103581 [Brettanomyces naardenensis]|uniref:Tubulin gamma chain n=1 Tax=Brettanomyces naardenensis TaxID=13370 RepID=A0A448YP03_BRENA|nr:DEKNAAC103581 [Brettanomyces naardenensis]